MKTQTIVKYEVVDPASDRKFDTYNRFEALAHYEAGALVYEKHVTSGKPMPFVQTEQTIAIMWNDSLEFEEVRDDSPIDG